MLIGSSVLACYISALHGFANDHEGLLMMNSHQQGCECINFAPQSAKLCHSAIWGCQDHSAALVMHAYALHHAAHDALQQNAL